jgi:hypothetical protein
LNFFSYHKKVSQEATYSFDLKLPKFTNRHTRCHSDTVSFKKRRYLFVCFVSRLRQANGDEDGPEGADAGVQPERPVVAHAGQHYAVQRRQDEVDLLKFLKKQPKMFKMY